MSQVAEATVPDIAEMAKVVATGGNLSDAQIWSVVEWLYVAKLGRGDSEQLMAEHADDLLSIASTVLPDLGVLVDRRRHDARLGGYEMVRVLSMLRTFPREHKISLFRVYLDVIVHDMAMKEPSEQGLVYLEPSLARAMSSFIRSPLLSVEELGFAWRMMFTLTIPLRSKVTGRILRNLLHNPVTPTAVAARMIRSGTNEDIQREVVQRAYQEYPDLVGLPPGLVLAVLREQPAPAAWSAKEPPFPTRLMPDLEEEQG